MTIRTFSIKNIFVCLLCILLSFISLSCLYGTNNFFYKGNKVENRVDYVHEIDFGTKINVKELPDKYTILVLADTHFGSPKKETETASFYKWLDEFNSKSTVNKVDKPKFCAILGDNVDFGYKEQFITYCNFTKEIENRGIPVITILGNHDLYNSGWDCYKEMCYPNCSLFKFETKNLTWYGIDSGTGDIGIKQFRILKKEFAKDKNPKVVMMHFPVANSKEMGTFSLHDSTERNLLIDLFAKTNVTTALCGHLHQVNSPKFNFFKEYGNPSFCYSENQRWTIYEVDEIKATVTKLE